VTENAPIPYAEMADELMKLVYSKHTWLNQFSGPKHPRPEHELVVRRRELAVLQQAAADYRHAAEAEAERR
jgi:hypothetical protein